MKDFSNTQVFFDSLDKVGIYVLEKNTHRILYANDTFKTFFPNYQSGCLCYQALGISEHCAICPEHCGSDICSCNINNDYKFSISEGFWEGSEAIISTLYPDTEHKLRAMQNNLKNNEAVINMMSDTLNIGLKTIIFDDDGTLTYLNDSLPGLLGYTREEFLTSCSGNFFDAIYQLDRASTVKRINDCIRESGEYSCEYRMRAKDGELKWFMDTGKMEVKDDGTIKLTGIVSDITNMKKNMSELEYQAHYDNLTGIYNRNNFYIQTKKLITANPDKEYAIIRWDISHFKVINDLFGHDEGDKLLRFVAHTLKNLIGINGTYGRFDADIFIMCVETHDDNIEKLMQCISDRLNNYPVDFDIMPCFGIYIIDDINIPVKLMCDRANLAHHTIKGNFIKRHAIYSDDLRTDLVREHEITSEMSIALDQEQFEVYLQPKYDLTHENIIGAEALVRWIHPEKGFIPPNQFIPIFERNGFIMKLDEYIWERTCMILKRWKDEGRKVIPISVNISRIDLYNPHLCEFLIELIEKYDLDPKLLELEITESAYTENSEQLMPVMRRLQQHGFVILMDDFGTGYSSLNMLKDVPVNILKIDMNFLTEDMEHGRGGIILSSIVRMAKWLSLPVVAEGVETNTQVDFLRSIGCNLAQGYYYSRPVPVAEFEKLLDYSKTGEADIDNRLATDIDLGDLWNPNSTNNMLFDNLLGAAAMYELSGSTLEIVRANDEYFKILGIDSGYLNTEERNIFKQIHPDDLVMFRRMIKSANDINPTIGEFRRLRRDGSVIWLRAKFKTLALTKNNERSIIYGSLSDITDRKQREINLETDFNSMSRAISDMPIAFGIFEITHEMRAVFVNDFMYKALGYTHEEFMSTAAEDLFKIMPAEDAKNLYYIITNTLATPIDLVTKFIRANGTVTRLKFKMSLSKSGDGKLIGYAIAMPAADTTAPTMFSKNMLSHVIMTSLNVAAFDYDATTDTMKYCITRNGVYSEYSASEYIAKSTKSHLIHPEYRDTFLNWLKNLLKDNADTSLDIMANFSSDAYTWFKGCAEVIKDEDGSVTNIIGCFRDIQLEKAADVKTNDTVDLFASVIDLAPGGVFKAKADGDFTLLYANDNFYKMRGYTKDEFEKFNHNKAINCVHPEDVEYVRGELNSAIAERKDLFSVETRIVTPANKVEYALITYKIIYHKDGPVVYGTTMNITALKQLELLLKKQTQRNNALTSDMLWYHEVDLSNDKMLNTFFRSAKTVSNDGVESYTDVCKNLLPYIHPDYKESFEKTSSIKNLIHEFEQGNKQVVLKYTIINAAQEYFETVATFTMDKNPFTGSIECFICGREAAVDSAGNTMVKDKAYHNMITSDLIVSYKVNFDKNTVEKYKGDDSVIDKIFNFDTFVKRIIARIPDETQKQYVLNLLNIDNINNRFETSSLSNSIEYIRYDKYGNPLWVRTSLALTYDEDGNKIGFINIRDINDYKNEQNLQQDVLKRYSAELKNSYDQIYEVNFTTDEIFTFDIDDTGVKKTLVTKLSVRDVIDDLLDRMHPDNDIDKVTRIFSYDFLDEMFSQQSINEYHLTALVRDQYTNEYRWTSYWGRKVHWNDTQDKILMFYSKNVTEEHMEQEKHNHMLKSALCLAEQANKAKSDFLSKVSHDIRTPMNAIMGMSAIARDSINNPEKLADCISSIDESAKYLLKLINNVLDMSKIENGKMIISKTEFNVVDMLHSMHGIFGAYKIEKNIDFGIFVDKNISDTVIGDELHMNQIIVNLLSNAFQYSYENGVVKLEALLVERTDSTEIVKFIITDSGIGMDKEQIEKIFEPFEQLNDNSTGLGSGLGLAIVHSLVHLMDGVIEVESEPERGSKFSVTIPFGIATKKPSKSDKATADTEYKFNNEKILLVEDNELNCEIAKSMLEFVNLDVDVAQNGKIALEKFMESPVDYYDAVLMDIRMPVMDGREATCQIRALPRADAKTVPIIAMSADAFSEDIKYSQRIGMDDYITKPVNKEHLYKSLKKFLDN